MQAAALNQLNSWHKLLSPTGTQCLAAAAELHAAGETVPRLQKKLRAVFADPELVTAAISQTLLREKAESKFGALGSQLLFTPAALEQASRLSVAQHHAERLKTAGITRVYDLGCGIGAESIAMLEAGISVSAYEVDPLTAAFAEHNLNCVTARHTAVTASVTVADVTGLTEQDFSDAISPNRDSEGAAQTASTQTALLFDPARRTSGHRGSVRVSPTDYSPGLDFVFSLASRTACAVKLGPGFPRELLPEDAEAEWVSDAGQALETLLWFGPLREPGVTRRATLLRGTTAHTLTAPADTSDVEPGELYEFLYEPDPAVIRARLIGDIARTLDAHPVSDGIAYLTSAALTQTPFAQCFRVINKLPLRAAEISKALQDGGYTSVQIKKRGVSHDPAEFRRKLRLAKPSQQSPKREATLFLTRLQGAHAALLAERVH